MPQEDDGASELDHPAEILRVIFPADDHAKKIMQPRKQTLDFPAAPVTTQYTTGLCGGFGSSRIMRSNQLHSEPLANLLIQWVTVLRAVADHAPGNFGQEALLDGGSDQLCFMR
jgi:hypothetical protein